MITKLASVTVYVDNQDEALKFYTEKLGFQKITDRQIPNGMRWVTVAPTKDSETRITLEDIKDSERAGVLPKALGSGTTWVFFTDDCRKTYRELKAKGVSMTQEPTEQPYGVEATFEDLYGNTFALVQPHA
jgi:predicted enzyme related to lactoylglutathione lyase